MIQSILSNLAVILLSHLIISSIVRNRDRLPGQLTRYFSLAIMAVTVISMFYLPILFGDYRFDLRLIPLIMLAMFGKAGDTLIVLVVVCSWRYLMGGDGAIYGILFGMTLPTLFVIGYSKISKLKERVPERIILVTVCWMISDLPIIFVLPDGPAIMQQIYLMRYSSFLMATLIYYALIHQESKRVAMKRKLQFLATHDQLTGLLNKQECLQRAERKIGSKRTLPAHFFVMVDLDHFKTFNDRYGHVAGDHVLRQIAGIFSGYQNEHMLASRYGGEEFLLYIGTESEEQAADIAETINQHVRSAVFRLPDGQAVHLTVSMGLARYEEGQALLEVIKAADGRLYQAKEKGRDQLVYQ